MSCIPSVVQVCTICLDTDRKLYVMSKYKLGKAYENLTGLSLSNMECTKFLCSECIHRLLSFSKFRYKSLRAHSVMEDLLRNYEVITLQHIKSIDRNIYQLKSDIIKIVLEPDHCDLYIDHSDKDIQADLDAIAHRVDHAVAMTNEEIHDTVDEDHTQQNMEVRNEDNINADRQVDLDRGFGNIMVKTEQNFYDDHLDIKTEIINGNDNCNDVIDLDAVNDDYLSDSTLVLDPVPILEEQTLLLNETQNFCYTQNLNFKTEQNVKATNEYEEKKCYHKLEIDNIKSDTKSSKRNNKLHDKLKFETTTENSEVYDKLFNGEDISKCESGMKIREDNSFLESNSDKETSLLVSRERKVDLAKLKKSAEITPYSCDICNYKCKLKISLTVHMKSHKGEKLFSCEICDYKCKLRHTLNVHMRKHTEETHFACDICKSNFKSRGELVIHSRTHASEKLFSCEICDYKCKLRHNLNVHMRKHTEGTPFVCDVCESKFKFRGNLIRHMKTNTCKKPFACNLCEYKTVHKYYFKKHQDVHEKPYACQLCPKKFAYKSSFENHVWFHTDKEYITCELCDFNCQNTTDLEMHMRSHEGETSSIGRRGKRTYACDLCESEFKQRHHLDSHMNTHSGDRPFACNFCELKFTQKVSLKKHMYLHTKEKPFACETCPYKCTSKIDLVKHVRTHTGEKPYACTYCDYRSSTSYSLLTHTRGHTGEKPFACKICHYKCSRTSQLVRHMRTHTGEKRFSCHLCDYKCTRHCNLQMHMRIHTGEMFSCDYCDYKTAHKSCVLVHVKRHMKLIADSKVDKSS